MSRSASCCRSFIVEHVGILPPSQRQLNLAETLALQSGIPLPEEVRGSAGRCRSFIGRAMTMGNKAAVGADATDGMLRRMAADAPAAAAFAREAPPVEGSAEEAPVEAAPPQDASDQNAPTADELRSDAAAPGCSPGAAWRPS